MEKIERKKRTEAEWAEIEKEVEELKILGVSERKACSYVGVCQATYSIRRLVKVAKAKSAVQEPVVPAATPPQNAQLDGIAYGLESIVLKLDKLIEIGSALLAAWEPKTPVEKHNDFGIIDASKAEHELGVRTFRDKHHL